MKNQRALTPTGLRRPVGGGLFFLPSVPDRPHIPGAGSHTMGQWEKNAGEEDTLSWHKTRPVKRRTGG